MTQKTQILDQLENNFMFAVIRGESEEAGYEISKACYNGGVKNIEMTFSTPNAQEVIKRLSEEFEGTDMVVGAGTVLDEVSARIAIINGAKFVVSPTWVPEVAKICNLYQIPYMPGCGSVTEIQQAMEAGCDVEKIFPGGVLGSSFIKDVHGPFPWANLMPSGGVNLDNMEDWINKGAWAIGVGSALTKPYATEGKEGVQEKAAEFSAKLKEIRNNQ